MNSLETVIGRSNRSEQPRAGNEASAYTGRFESATGEVTRFDITDEILRSLRWWAAQRDHPEYWAGLHVFL